MEKWRKRPGPRRGAAQGSQGATGTGYLQGRVQIPAGLMEGLLGCVSGVAHSFQRVDVLQAVSSLLFFLSSYLGQFLQEDSRIHCGEGTEVLWKAFPIYAPQNVWG